MNTWFPDFNALWLAENVVAGLHNVLTLRGAQVRDTLAWAKYINIALYKWGDQAEVLFQSHSWPRWGTERIQEVLRGERDMYANLNNQVLNLANNGVTINEVHNVYEPPPSPSRTNGSPGATMGPMNTTAAPSSSATWDSGTAIPPPCSPCRRKIPPRSMSR